MGNNIKAMECVSTIRKEYPHINIFVVDENKEPVIKKEYGEEIYKEILE